MVSHTMAKIKDCIENQPLFYYINNTLTNIRI